MSAHRRTPSLLMYAVVAGITLVLATMVLFDDEAGILRLHRMQQHHDALTEETRELEQLRDHLTVRLDRLEAGDPAMLEAAARDKNMIRPGDTVYRIQYAATGDAQSR